MLSLQSKIVLLILVILLIFSTSAKSDDAVYVSKGQVAPFSGILFTEGHANQIRRDLLEGDKSQIRYEGEVQKVQSLNQIIQLKDTEIELYRKQNVRLLRAEQTSENMKYVWFGLGILATGMAVYGAGALAR